MRPFTSCSLKSTISFLLVCTTCLNSHAQQPQTAPFPATPPYTFKVIAQTGDVIGGQKIKNFITTSGANVAINDKGQVAFETITETGVAIFRGDTRRPLPPVLIASATTSNKNRVGLSHPIIDSQGRVAYLRIDASQPRGGLAVINNTVVLRPGQLSVNQSKLAVRAFIPFAFDAADRLETFAVFDGNHAPVVCLNGKYSKDLDHKLDNAIRGLPYPVHNDRGQVLYRVTSMDEPEQVLRRGDNKLYPLRPTVYAINDHGQVFVGDVKGKLAIFPYADCLATTNPHLVSEIQPEYDNKYIPNANEGIGEALQGETSTLVSSLEAGKKHYYFDTTLHVYNDHTITRTTNHLSIKGVSVAINNHNQIAFFVEWQDANSTMGADGYAHQEVHQALLVGSPPNLTNPGTINWSAIYSWEATPQEAMTMSVPNNDSVVIGNSGPTIAHGVDLGQHNQAWLDGLHLDATLSAQLSPYLNMRGQAALDYVTAHPLTLEQPQVNQIDQSLQPREQGLVTKHFDADVNGSQAFEDMPEPAETVYTSIYYQYGTKAPATLKY